MCQTDLFPSGMYMELCTDTLWDIQMKKWSCQECGNERDLGAIEAQLVCVARSRARNYQLQDLKCSKCKQVNVHVSLLRNCCPARMSIICKPLLSLVRCDPRSCSKKDHKPTMLLEANCCYFHSNLKCISCRSPAGILQGNAKSVGAAC